MPRRSSCPVRRNAAVCGSFSAHQEVQVAHVRPGSLEGALERAHVERLIQLAAAGEVRRA